MELNFDLAEDEFPIFMAETDEQLQVLDDGLIRLEREGEDMELLQALFRAAHTLKGTAGMIGHKRMVNLTHSMETSLDCVRKHTMPVTTALIDLCLEATDALRNLREEVITRKECGVAVDVLTDRFSALVLSGNSPTPAVQAVVAPPVVTPAKSAAVEPSVPISNVTQMPAKSAGGYMIRVEISQNSIASAARAFQVMMELQGLGSIKQMSPTQEEIETSNPVHLLIAELETDKNEIDILKAFETLSELEKVEVLPSGSIPVLPQVGQLPDIQKEAVLPPPPPAIPTPPPAPVRVATPTADTQTSNAPKPGGSPVAIEKTVRTSVERLDNLMNLVGELITDRNRLYQIRSTLETSIRNSSQLGCALRYDHPRWPYHRPITDGSHGHSDAARFQYI